ncbi:MAG: ComF family protein [Pseudomonadota bacterium]
MPMPYDPGGTIVSAAALANPPDFDRARSVCRYDGHARRLITGFKYNDRQEPRALLGRWMAMAGHDLIADCDVIIPVPLHRWRLISRRFNQSAELAREIARLTAKPIAYHVLARHRNTPQQAQLTSKERLKNPRGAFRVSKTHQAKLKGKRVLLVDDVMTTGATVNACARELKKAGASGVDVLTLAMALDDGREPEFQ